MAISTMGGHPVAMLSLGMLFMQVLRAAVSTAGMAVVAETVSGRWFFPARGLCSMAAFTVFAHLVAMFGMHARP